MKEENNSNRGKSHSPVGLLERIVSWWSRRKKTNIHYYAERQHASGYSYQEGCVSISGRLTIVAVDELRNFIDSELEKAKPDKEWTNITRIMSITVLVS